MLTVPAPVQELFDRGLDKRRVPARERRSYRKWLRFYLDFCRKYDQPATEGGSLSHFLEKLTSKGQTAAQREQASRAVELYYEVCPPVTPSAEAVAAARTAAGDSVSEGPAVSGVHAQQGTGRPVSGGRQGVSH